MLKETQRKHFFNQNSVLLLKMIIQVLSIRPAEKKSKISQLKSDCKEIVWWVTGPSTCILANELSTKQCQPKLFYYVEVRCRSSLENPGCNFVWFNSKTK